MKDVLFRQVTVYDGSGAAPRVCDVSVAGGKIAAVGDGGTITEQHAMTVDGKGLSLAPGFIDAHSHSDNQVLSDPARDCKLRQGITTEIAGQCGSSNGPMADPVNPVFYKHRAAVTGKPPVVHHSYDEMLSAIDDLHPGTNLLVFVGHTPLRGSVIGMENRPATAKELDKMKDLLDGAMRQGAPGFTSGLVYSPSQYGTTEELVELAKVAAKYGGMYSTHMRGEGSHLLESVKEVVHIVKSTGIRANISHFKVMMEPNRSLLPQAIELIEKTNAEGFRITFDVYPYTATSAGFLSNLPPSYLTHGIDWLLDELSTPAGVARLEKALMEPTEQWEDPLRNAGFDKCVLVVGKNTPDAVGKSYHQYAVEQGLTDAEAFARIIVQNRGAGNDVRFLMNEEDVAMLYRHPLCMVGSDGVYSGHHALCHPRAFATVPRYLGRYVREQKVQTFEEGIRRVTGMTADTYHLKTKGYVRAGYDADLVLFDAGRIIDRADYTDPFKPNEGIEMVFSGGQAAVVNDRLTGVFNGKTLRYTAD